jgi:hypothetical protein
MGTASKLFYLAVFTLLNPSRADSHGSKLKAHQPGACAVCISAILFRNISLY